MTFLLKKTILTNLAWIWHGPLSGLSIGIGLLFIGLPFLDPFAFSLCVFVSELCFWQLRNSLFLFQWNQLVWRIRTLPCLIKFPQVLAVEPGRFPQYPNPKGTLSHWCLPKENKGDETSTSVQRIMAFRDWEWQGWSWAPCLGSKCCKASHQTRIIRELGIYI